MYSVYNYGSTDTSSTSTTIQLIRNLSVDYGDGVAIFVYGGCTGLICGLSLYLKYRNNEKTTTKNSKLYTGNINSVSLSFFGSVLLTILFPVLSLHPDMQQTQMFLTVIQVAPYSIIYSIASSLMSSIGFSILLNSKLNIRDMINAPISGAIVGLICSYYVLSPVFAQILGFVAGAVQVVIQNFV